MTQALYVILGWLLGLFSPIIADRIRAKRQRNKFKVGITHELADLKYRIAIVSFQLRQRGGTLDAEYLTWLRDNISDYEGSEANERIRDFVERLLELPTTSLDVFGAASQAEPGIGLSLKTFSASYFESNIDRIADLPHPLQRACHEFRNHLAVVNQEITRIMDAHTRTFDSSLSEHNHERLVQDIDIGHRVVANMCRTIVGKINAIQTLIAQE